jgi:hypothetical protein
VLAFSRFISSISRNAERRFSINSCRDSPWEFRPGISSIHAIHLAVALDDCGEICLWKARIPTLAELRREATPPHRFAAHPAYLRAFSVKSAAPPRSIKPVLSLATHYIRLSC